MIKSTDGESAPARGPLIPQIRVTPQQRNRLVIVGVALLVAWWLLSQAMDAMSPFIVALVLGYLMLPLVDLIGRVMPRALAILLVYAVFVAAIWLLLAWLVPVITGQIAELVKHSDQYSKQAQDWVAQATQWYQSLPIADSLRASLENAAKNALGDVAGALQTGVLSALAWLTRATGAVVGFLIIPFWLFYVLKDKDRGINAFNNMLPRSWRSDVWRIVRIINHVLSSYIRGQIFLGLVVGSAVTVGLLIVGARYALLLGAIAGITELVPVIGPIIGAVPGVILAAFHPEGWVMVLKVLLVYVIVQQLENNLLVPKIQGDSVKVHPAIIMVALVVGSQVAGIFGMIVAVPVAAILRDVYLYLYRRFTEGYSPREAEASVPSRRDEESPRGKRWRALQLSDARGRPGINTEDEMIESIDEGEREPSEEDTETDETAGKPVPG